MRSYNKADIQDILHKIDNVRSDISSLKKQTDYKSGLVCPKCGSVRNDIYNSRKTKEQFCIRRRECLDCGSKWGTVEILNDLGIKDRRNVHG